MRRLRTGFALAMFTGSITVAAQQPGPTTAVAAPVNVKGWIRIDIRDWDAHAREYDGKRVELRGSFQTSLIYEGATAEGRLTTGEPGVSGKVRVLMDSISPEQVQWFQANRCHVICNGVFVRGTVVSNPFNLGRRALKYPALLRMIDASFESRGGAAPASFVTIDQAPSGTTANKPLLAPGTIPTVLPAGAVTRIPVQQQTTTQVDHANALRARSQWDSQGMIPGPERPESFETPYRSIRDTHLSNVFARYPRSGNHMWPRVALVIENGGGGNAPAIEPYWRGGEKIVEMCYRLRARLWTGPAASEDIAPFNWCLSEMRFNVAYRDLVIWAHSPASNMLEETTGARVTLGPNPPMARPPNWVFGHYFSGDVIMLANTLLDMQFPFAPRIDGRVWIVDERAGAGTSLAPRTQERP
jgi:hypothetical protein